MLRRRGESYDRSEPCSGSGDATLPTAPDSRVEREASRGRTLNVEHLRTMGGTVYIAGAMTGGNQAPLWTALPGR